MSEQIQEADDSSLSIDNATNAAPVKPKSKSQRIPKKKPLPVAVSTEGQPTALNFGPVVEITKYLEAFSRGEFDFEIELDATVPALADAKAAITCLQQEFAQRQSNESVRNDEAAKKSYAQKAINNNIIQTANSIALMVQKLSESADEAAMQALAFERKTTGISDVTQHLTLQIQQIASSAENSQQGISSVSTASEEMSATVSEIAQNAERARSVTGDAVLAVNAASDEVALLEKAAVQISNVTETIVEIAEQTKLLALNATIEAARAGEAGKGFAVVAGEVKELAQQTNSATADIRQKIEAIQTATGHTIKKIRNIANVMQEVNDFVSTIATATEEQAITTGEIAENLIRSTQEISTVTDAVGELTRVADNMAATVEDVSRDTSRIKTTAENLSLVAHELELTEQQLLNTLTELN